jgi:histidine ammonia-lyase
VTAALKAGHVLNNLKDIIAIELLAGRLALDYHKPLKAGRGVEALAGVLRKHIKPLKQDRTLYEDFATIRELADGGDLDGVLDGLE